MCRSFRARLWVKAHCAGLCVVFACLYANPGQAGEDDSYINVKVWDTKHNPLFFPERDDPRLKLRRLADPGSTFGIAFSGGGVRSAAAIIGQLNALNTLGWLDQAHYVTAVSGGSWAVIPFVFLPDQYCRRVYPQDCDSAFLGDYVPPEQLNDAYLRAKSEHSLARDLYQSSMVWRYFRRLFTRGDETFSSAIGRNFLDRYGLNQKRWFAQRETIDEVVKSSGKNYDDFYVTAAGRPFLIVAATLLARRRSALWFDKHFLEITPLYAGIRVRDDAVLDDVHDPYECREHS